MTPKWVILGVPPWVGGTPQMGHLAGTPKIVVFGETRQNSDFGTLISSAAILGPFYLTFLLWGLGQNPG